MIPVIAPFGVSNDATLFLRHALELAIAKRRNEPDGAEDPVHIGLLSATLKLLSGSRETLESEAERQGLARLLAIAAELALHARKDARWSRLPLEGDPTWEIEDLRRRARYSLKTQAARPGKEYARAV